MKPFPLLVIVISVVFGYFESEAQLTIPKVLPSECADEALNLIPNASDVQLVGIINIGTEIDLGLTTFYTGMDLETGTAAMWTYRVYSSSLDSLVTSVMLNFPLPCTQLPSGQIPDTLPAFDVFMAIPPNTIEGVTLVNAVKANAYYKTFAYAYPDSLPFLTSLWVLPEDFLQFPAGTPAWQLVWLPADQTSLPFICFVHGLTGQTLCGSELVMTVTEQQLASKTAVYPNPADEAITIDLPVEMTGTSVKIEAFSQNGQSVVMSAGQRLTSSRIVIPTSHLSGGLWYLRITDASSTSLTTSKHVIIQH